MHRDCAANRTARHIFIYAADNYDQEEIIINSTPAEDLLPAAVNICNFFNDMLVSTNITNSSINPNIDLCNI